MNLDKTTDERWKTARAIDIGSGPHPAEGYIGMDSAVRDHPNVLHYDALNSSGWPVADGQLHGLRASHFIEHIPAMDMQRASPRSMVGSHGPQEIEMVGSHGPQEIETVDMLVWFFEVAYRACRQGASFELIWPALRHENAFRDPTHRRFLPLGFLDYLSVDGRNKLGVPQYDFRCNWVLRSPRDLMMVVDSNKVEAGNLPADTDLLWNVVGEYRATLYKEELIV